MSPWTELGIAPTDDRSAIRRAYAARLKQSRPEDDRDAFQRLRAAYEMVLQQAERPPVEPDVPVEAGEAPVATDVAANPMAEPAPAAPPVSAAELALDPEQREALAAARTELEQGDAGAAAVAIERIRDRNLLPLALESELADRLLVLLINERSLSGGELLRITEQFGWDKTSAGPQTRHGYAEAVLRTRLDAELWLAALRRQSHSRKFYFGGQESGAARLLLGRGRFLLSWLVPPEPPLTQRLAELDGHWHWLGHNFDEGRLAGVRRLVAGRYFRFHFLIYAAAIMLAFKLMVPKLPFGFLIFGWTIMLALRKAARPILAVTTAFVLLIGWAAMPSHAPVGTAASPQTLEQRAEAGDINAQIDLGANYANADDPRNHALAAQWMRRASDRGSPLARRNMGILYQRGIGVPQDYAQAAEWFRRAMADDAESAALLAVLYDKGLGVPQDLAEARRLYRSAAERDNVNAQVNLALMLASGRGGAMDRAAAFDLFMTAARRDHPVGMNGVGYSYLVGNGTERNLDEARRWLSRAAEFGQPNAMHTLGSMYLTGQGLPLDLPQAYYWFTLAARNYPDGDERLSAAREMRARAFNRLSEAERAAVDMAIEQWQPRKTAPR